VCNSLSLSLSNIKVCSNNLGLLKADDTCTANPEDQLCESGDVKVTGVSLDGTKSSIQCGWAADTLNFLMDNCGTHGGQFELLTLRFSRKLNDGVGSAVANHNGNFIVHVNDHWV
jgi:hypothetical protein